MVPMMPRHVTSSAFNDDGRHRYHHFWFGINNAYRHQSSE